MQRAYRSPAEMWWIAFMLRRLSGSSVPTGGMHRTAGVAICRSAAGRGSMTGPPEDVTETPDLVGTRHGRINRRLVIEPGTADRTAARRSRDCAKLRGIDIANIRVPPAEIGGGFGGKTLVYIEPVALALSCRRDRL